MLLAGAPALVNAAESPPSWVFFADRGREAGALAVDIDERAVELSSRALDRRKRARGDRGVDARDLGPAPGYVAAVLGTGARLRSSSRWLNAVSVDADAAQRAAIAELPGVLRLQPVARRRTLAPLVAARSDAPPALTMASAPRRADEDGGPGVALAQLELLGVASLHACGLTGAGVVVAVQDSGFSLEHAALKNIHVIAARDFLNDDDIVADEPGDPEGQHNHGTMALSLLAGNDPGNYMGAAPGISVILSKTEDSSVEEPFEEDRFVEGLEWSEAMGADLFTSSLGYFDWYSPQDFDGHTAVTTIAAVIAVEQGLIMFSAVGNTGPGPTTLMSPSDADGVIAVGAVDRDGVVAEFSSRGPTADGRIKPDIAAPGKGVWVVNPNSQTNYNKGNGTSLATPLAAGAAALLLEAFPDLDPTSMRTMLQQSSSRADTPDNATSRPGAQRSATTAAIMTATASATTLIPRAPGPTPRPPVPAPTPAILATPVIPASPRAATIRRTNPPGPRRPRAAPAVPRGRPGRPCSCSRGCCSGSAADDRPPDRRDRPHRFEGMLASPGASGPSSRFAGFRGRVAGLRRGVPPRVARSSGRVEGRCRGPVHTS